MAEKTAGLYRYDNYEEITSLSPYVLMIASDVLFDPRGEFLGSSYPMKT